MKRCLLTLVVSLALIIPSAAGAATFGAEVGSGFTYQVRGDWSAARVERSLQALYKAGGRVGRTDSDWANAEPHPPRHGHHVYNWAYNDLIMSEMAAARLRWEPTLAFAPRWAEVHRSRVLHLKSGRAIAYLPPAKNGNFAAYARAFMKRYGRHGSFWRTHRSLHYVPVTTVEVWNEPDNIHDWGKDINLQDYARMYEAVRTAVHRVDRHARVVTGGLAWTESSLPRLLKAFRGKRMDAVAMHPYGANPKQSIKVARDALADIRRYHRGSTPVLANEYGWTSTRDTWGSTNPRHVKKYAYDALIGLSKLRLAEILPFEWTNSTWGLSTGAFARAVAKVHHHGHHHPRRHHRR